MNRQFPGADSRPWHRQFWPWFLMLLPAAVVVAGLTTVFIAHRHADDLVVDDYYKDGLAINQQLEKKQRATERSIAAQLSFSADTVIVNLNVPAGMHALRLFLSHPLEADRDFEVSLTQQSPGVFRGELREQVGPRWHWILEDTTLEGWRLDGEVQTNDVRGNADGD